MPNAMVLAPSFIVAEVSLAAFMLPGSIYIAAAANDSMQGNVSHFLKPDLT